MAKRTMSSFGRKLMVEKFEDRLNPDASFGWEVIGSALYFRVDTSDQSGQNPAVVSNDTVQLLSFIAIGAPTTYITVDTTNSDDGQPLSLGLDVSAGEISNAQLLTGKTFKGFHVVTAEGDDMVAAGGLPFSVFADLGSGNDTFMGGSAADSVLGGDGNDSLVGNGGADTIRGGAGNDTLTGGTGNDQLYGEAGNDIVNGETNDAVLSGGTNGAPVGVNPPPGNNGDLLNLTVGTGNTLPGNGFVNGFTNDDFEFISVGVGNFTIDINPSSVNTPNALLTGMNQGDTRNFIRTTGGVIDVSTFPDGFGGSPTIGNNASNVIGSPFVDYIIGDARANKLDGRAGNDYVIGNDGNDSLLGGDGNDTLDGGNGADSVAGNDGDDSMLGGAGSDTMDGGAGNDTVLGGDDDDTLTGGAGVDFLSGGNGNDRINIEWVKVAANEGFSIYNGGAGADTFRVFGMPPAPGTVVADNKITTADAITASSYLSSLQTQNRLDYNTPPQGDSQVLTTNTSTTGNP